MRKRLAPLPGRLPRLRLVSNWRKLHRSFTVKLSLLLTLLSVAQMQWPLFQSFLHPRYFAAVSMILAIGIALLRYVEQRTLHHQNDTQQEPPDAWS